MTFLLGTDANYNFVHQLKNGYRMGKADNASHSVGEIIKSCWSAEPGERPTGTNVPHSAGIVRQLFLFKFK